MTKPQSEIAKLEALLEQAKKVAAALPTATEPVRRQRRQRRELLTDLQVRELPIRSAPYFYPDPELSNHGIRVRPSGDKAYYVIRRDPHGKQRWKEIGAVDAMKIEAARAKARTVIERIKQGLAPVEEPKPKADTVADAVDRWWKGHVVKEKLRSSYEIKRIVDRHILPHWGENAFEDIKRRDVAIRLDEIEEQSGGRTADTVLAVLRSITRRYIERGRASDDFVSPFADFRQRGQRKRKRVLTDAEIRAVWKTADSTGAFGALVKLLLLTGQRRGKVIKMRWSDVNLTTGIWKIPREEREKGAPESLKLPAQAVAILRSPSLPQLVGNDAVFGIYHGSNSRNKQAFDKACGVTGWVLHDCRRTARTLLSKAGVRPEIKELCLGHAQPAIKEIYDQYDYQHEIADALQRLAALYEIILNNKPTDDIPALRKQIDKMVGEPGTGRVVKLRSASAVS